MQIIIAVFLVVSTVSMTALNVRRVISTGTVEGMKASSRAINLCTMSSWAIYGFPSGIPTLTATNLVTVVGMSVISVIGVRSGEFRVWKMAGIVATYWSAGAVLLLTMGLSGLATLASIVFFTAYLPEVIEAVKNPGGRGLSIGALTILLMQSIFWTGIGIAHGNPWLVCTSAFASVQSAFLVGRTVFGRLARRNRSRHLEPAFPFALIPTTLD